MDYLIGGWTYLVVVQLCMVDTEEVRQWCEHGEAREEASQLNYSAHQCKAESHKQPTERNRMKNVEQVTATRTHIIVISLSYLAVANWQ